MKSHPSSLIFPRILWLAAIAFACGNALQAQTPVVDVSTTSPTAMPRKMTGYNNEDFRTAYDIVTTDCATHIGQLNLGFWRWYAGTVEGVRNWQRGNYDDEKCVQYIATDF